MVADGITQAPEDGVARRVWWRLGVRMRSALAAAAVVALALGVSALAFIHTARSELTRNVDAAATQRASDVAAVLSSDDDDRIAQTLRASPAEQTVVQILDASGTVIAATSSIAGEPPLSPLRPKPGVTLRQQRALPAADEDPFRIVALGVETGRGARVVLAAESLRPVYDTSEVVTVILGTGMPILTLVVGAATFWFVGRSLRPVEAIRSRVAGITGRDLHARVPVPAARDEVGRLAETMNGMLDRLETSAAVQRRFVADASHELRSPLSTVRAGLDILAAAELPGNAATHVRRLQSESERIAQLVSDLLLLARVDEHGLMMRRDDVDLDDLGYAERDRLATQYPGLAVELRLSPVRVTGDAHHLARALRNLTDNAARHAHRRLALRVWADQAGSHLEVTDDGPGIPVADRGRVFDRFVRLDDSRSRTDGGAGLGLSITREIVAAHHGTIVITDPVTDPTTNPVTDPTTNPAVPAEEGGGPGVTIRITLPPEPEPAIVTTGGVVVG
jgi:signal transduction histidine kinase